MSSVRLQAERVFPGTNEVLARKEKQKEIGQLEHNKPRRLHQQ